eukprot:gene16626-19755_t
MISFDLPKTTEETTESPINALLASADKLIEQSSYEEAIAVLTEAITISAEDPRPYDLRGDLYKHQRLYNEAIADYQKVLKLMPDDVQCLTSLVVCYDRLGQIDLASDILQHILTIDPKNIQALIGHGDIEMSRNNLAVALDRYVRVLNIEKDNIRGLHGAGRVAHLQNNLPAAVKLFERAIRLCLERGLDRNLETKAGAPLPGLSPFFDASVVLAHVHEKMGAHDKSLEIIDVVLQIYPTSVLALVSKATALLRMDRRKESNTYVEAALAAGAPRVQLVLKLADCLYDMGNYKESMTIYCSVAADTLSRDTPEEAIARVDLINKMLRVTVSRLMALAKTVQPPILITDANHNAIHSIIDSKPTDLPDICNKANRLVKILTEAMPTIKDTNQQDYLDAMIDVLHQTSLTSHHIHRMREDPKITVDRTTILDPMYTHLFRFYDQFLSDHILNNNNNNNKS